MVKCAQNTFQNSNIIAFKLQLVVREMRCCCIMLGNYSRALTIFKFGRKLPREW